MYKYIDELIKGVTEITQIFNKPINEATINHALRIEQFYIDVSDIALLIDYAETNIREDKSALISELEALQKIISKYLTTEKKEWISSSTHEIIRAQIKRLDTQYTNKKAEVEVLDQNLEKLNSDTPIDKIYDYVDRLCDIRSERDSLKILLLEENRKLLTAANFRFVYADALIIQVGYCLETIITEVIHLSQNSAEYTSLLITIVR